MTADTYAPYRAMLAGERVPIQDGNPHPGRYCLRRHKDGPRLPVAIWADDNNTFLCLVDGKAADVFQTWISCAKNPITPEVYDHVMTKGSWPDEPAVVRFNHNAPPADEFEAMQREAEDAAAGAEGWLKATTIASQREADLAANWLADLRKLSSKAEGQREAEKRPHLEAGRAVDQKFKPVTERLRAACDAIKSALTPWLASEAERKREAAAQQIAAGADPANLNTKVKAGGARGKSVGLRTYKLAKVNDWPALMAALQDNPELRALAQDIANRAAGKDVALAGCEVITERKAA